MTAIRFPLSFYTHRCNDGLASCQRSFCSADCERLALFFVSTQDDIVYALLPLLYSTLKIRTILSRTSTKDSLIKPIVYQAPQV
jgi:hypothetical protein